MKRNCNSNLFTYQQPVIKIIRYRAGDSGILPLKIQEALDRRRRDNKPVVSFTDEALKNPGPRITIERRGALEKLER